MKKIVFGITGLTIGGAEKVLVDIANELSNKYDITIFTLYAKGELEKELSDKVKVASLINRSYEELSSRERIAVSLRLFINKKSIYKKNIYGKYDTEIAFLEGPITRLFSQKNNKVKKIAWVHNDIGQVFGKNFKAKLKRMLDKKCYSQYNKIVFVSQDNKEQFEKVYNIKNDKLIITNYISPKRVIEKAKQSISSNLFSKEKINFLTVARLTKQKAIDRIIKVHSELIRDGYDHNFWVIGDGPEQENLKELINSYGVQNTFKLLGKKNNPYPYIKNCNIFALLSNFEGYGMTLVEARILNKPIIITNTAAREAIERI